jgi:hypothetical protein
MLLSTKKGGFGIESAKLEGLPFKMESNEPPLSTSLALWIRAAGEFLTFQTSLTRINERCSGRN